MPTPEIERTLAEGAARSRVAATGGGAAAAGTRGDARTARWDGSSGRLADWYRALPPERRKLIIGIGLFLLFDLIAGLAAVTMGTHF